MAITLTSRQLQFYNLLQAKLGSETAEAFVVVLDERVADQFEQASKTLATKEDLVGSKGSIKDDINRLEVKLAEQKVALIQWMVSIAMALGLMIIGLYFK